MKTPVFIGDEVSAAGFRLAGVRIRTPSRDDLFSVVAWARNNASLILITTEYLSMLGNDEQQKLVSQMEPPVAIVPDLRLKFPVKDLATRLRSHLGVLE